MVHRALMVQHIKSTIERQVLTEEGHLYIKLYDNLCEEQKHFLRIEKYIDNYDEFKRILNRKILHTNVRNQLYGKVTLITKEGLMNVVEMDVNSI
jgi:hypothetical protein